MFRYIKGQQDTHTHMEYTGWCSTVCPYPQG